MRLTIRVCDSPRKRPCTRGRQKAHGDAARPPFINPAAEGVWPRREVGADDDWRQILPVGLITVPFAESLCALSASARSWSDGRFAVQYCLR